MRKFILFLSILGSTSVFSQFSDHFEDGNFTDNPVWMGDTAKFTVDEQHRLSLAAPKETATAQLFTTSALSYNTLWEFELTMYTKPTTGNYVKVYLCADTIGAGKLWGLCLRIGYNKDVSLWYEPSSGPGKSLLKGIVGRLDMDTISLRVKASLDGSGVFCLDTKLPGESAYVREGEISLLSSNVPGSSYVGIGCVYSSTKSKNVYFLDEFEVVALQDTFPPDPEELFHSGDIIINEVLYQPFPGGDEYVELYNRSEIPVDISRLSIATRKTDGTLQRIKPIAVSEMLLPVGGYVLVTGRQDSVCRFYNCSLDIRCCELGTMVSLPDAGASIVIFNHHNQEVIDEFTYNNKMHAVGIDNPKGVSLERITPEGNTNNAANWTSASADAGYGTPGAKNSSYRENNGDITTGISVVEPDPSAGIDYFEIRYSFLESGSHCNLSVFDTAGRLVERVLNNSLLAASGTISWTPRSYLKPGIYIIYMETVWLHGEVKKFKLPVIVRR